MATVTTEIRLLGGETYRVPLSVAAALALADAGGASKYFQVSVIINGALRPAYIAKAQVQAILSLDS